MDLYCQSVDKLREGLMKIAKSWMFVGAKP